MQSSARQTPSVLRVMQLRTVHSGDTRVDNSVCKACPTDMITGWRPGAGCPSSQDAVLCEQQPRFVHGLSCWAADTQSHPHSSLFPTAQGCWRAPAAATTLCEPLPTSLTLGTIMAQGRDVLRATTPLVGRRVLASRHVSCLAYGMLLAKCLWC